MLIEVSECDCLIFVGRISLFSLQLYKALFKQLFSLVLIKRSTISTILIDVTSGHCG